MSGLAAMWRRDGAPLDGTAFQRVTAALNHRAVDGDGRWLAEGGSVALWHGQFWTTPEDQGERQPLVLGHLTLIFDGRIDNRQELGEALGLTRAEAATLSDAGLALRAYGRWGEAFVSRLKGPWAVVVWDASTRRLLCARDAIGRRTLFYRIDGDVVSIASEPGALVGDLTGERLDEVFLAHFFALRPAPDGRTMYEAVRELPPGHSMGIKDGGVHTERHGPPDLPPIHYPSIADYGERFAELLDQAVLRRMRALDPPAIMMSGGMDSTSVAALAARAMAARAPGRPLSVISYVFDELTELDERAWIAPMVAMYGLDATAVIADDAWPLSDFDSWSWNASGPDTGPFRPLNERLYAAARAKGHRVLLTGAASDGFFSNGCVSWLSDLVEDGRSAEALVEVIKHIRRLGARAVLQSDSARRLAARLMGRSSRPAPAPPWLTEFAAARLAASPTSGNAPATRRLPRDTYALLTSLDQSNGIATGDGEHRARVEVRDPFTDADLVSFMLSIPAYTLYNQGAIKYVLRVAMASALPHAVLSRRTRSNIEPLFWRGVGERGPRVAMELVEFAGAFWAKYVRSETFLGTDMRAPSAPPPALVRWQCLSFEWWMIRTTLSPVTAA